VNITPAINSARRRNCIALFISIPLLELDFVKQPALGAMNR
jgi:hypothetical protein